MTRPPASNPISSASLLTRWVVFLFGLWIMTIGIAISVRARLGTSPISSPPAVLMEVLPISFGVLTIIMNCLFVIIQLAVFRKDFTAVNYLQFAIAFLFGTLNDVSLKVFDFITPANYFQQWLLVVLGAVLLALGVFIEVMPRLIYVPGEGLVAAIANKTNWRFGTVKQFFDWTLVMLSAASSLIFFGHLEGVREGTVFAAFAVGGLVKVYKRIWDAALRATPSTAS